jgi:hypothetical protein
MNFLSGINPEMQLGAVPNMQPAAQQAAPSPNVAPDGIADFLKLHNLGNERADIERQMQIAQALRGGGGRQYKTGLGAALGGIGDIVRQGVGGYQMGQANEALKANTAELADPKYWSIIQSLRSRGG